MDPPAACKGYLCVTVTEVSTTCIYAYMDSSRPASRLRSQYAHFMAHYAKAAHPSLLVDNMGWRERPDPNCLRACLRVPARHTLARFRVPARGGAITPIPYKSAQRIFA